MEYCDPISPSSRSPPHCRPSTCLGTGLSDERHEWQKAGDGIAEMERGQDIDVVMKMWAGATKGGLPTNCHKCLRGRILMKYPMFA